MKNKANTLAVYDPKIDLKEFRLIAEPTADAIVNDIRKFYDVVSRGADMFLLGRFLLGVSLIKAKKLVGNASRGGTAKGEGGWMAWKKEMFPECSNDALTDAVKFSHLVFEGWSKTLISGGAKLAIGEPESFQLPENPDELRGLLGAIKDVMDGKNVTKFLRDIGRIREAQRPGNPNAKGRKKPASPEAALEARRKIVRENIEAAMLAVRAVQAEFTILPPTDEDDLLLTAYLATLAEPVKAVGAWINKPADKRDAKKIRELFAE